MRLDTHIRELNGVGEKHEKALVANGICTVKDLLYYLPRAYQNRSDVKELNEEQYYNEYHSYILTVTKEPTVAMIRRGMTLLKFQAIDDTGKVNITFFNQNYLRDVFHVGGVFRFWGKVTKEKRTLCLNSPTFEPVLPDQMLAPLVSVYPLFSGVNQKYISKLVREAIANVPFIIKDYLPESVRKSEGLCTLQYALRNIHFPDGEEALERAIKRLTFDELYTFAIAVAKMKSITRELSAPIMKDTDVSPLYSLLSYEPTGAQVRAINDIALDLCPKNQNLEYTKPMSRIIVGDVGSGKTLCATAAAYIACKNGYQCALMCPTEILAFQHFEDLYPIFERLGISCELLTGSTPAKAKREILARLKSGKTSFVIGTHALIQANVEFKNLGLAITDEQHRFGAMQRASLSEKSKSTHTLVMSATPIPRTLSFMMYGDLDISRIDEMPPGRKRVSTYVVNEEFRTRLNGFIRKQVDNGNQVYIVCPAVEEQKEDMDNVVDYNPFEILFDDDTPPLKAAVDYARDLQENVFSDLNIAFIHGKMKAKEKDAIMMDFANNKINILVSTTVIEVGVNVPNATLMIVENAERFGLSQLHQLRGRVGRGNDQSYCVLVSDSKGENARNRLEIMRTTYDGYAIAEKDLEMRGPGDFFSSSSSIRQSGDMGFDIAKKCTNTALSERAFACAKETIKNDPSLSLPEHSLLLERINEIYKEKSNTIN